MEAQEMVVDVVNPRFSEVEKFNGDLHEEYFLKFEYFFIVVAVE